MHLSLLYWRWNPGSHEHQENTPLSYTPSLINSEAFVMLLLNLSSSYLSLWSTGITSMHHRVRLSGFH